MPSNNLTEFILLGLPCSPRIQTFIYAVFQCVYIMSLFGNLIIIATTCTSHQLQTPMYFLLTSLAFLDIFFISSTVPKLLSILLSGNQVISLSGCLIQFYVYISLGGTEFFLLAAMSLDRYLAICHPLRYSAIMTRSHCRKLTIGSWVFGFLEGIPFVFLISQLQFCGRTLVINHYFCDASALLHLSCSETWVARNIIFGFASFTILSSFTATVSSYFFILLSIYGISSAGGRRKMFSTCSSHFIVVSISYGSCIFLYVRSGAFQPSSTEMAVSVFNSIFIPFLNPYIYTLRNQIIKNILKGLWKMNVQFCGHITQHYENKYFGE
ncbi:olfactory receptor 6F1 [Xenopus laevis]|uniref:Olfactory receptor n=2 Tax=Xenopus laevis TaxID=8355 RepID=A0A1L8HZH8_XENLA|nr:olfactory receptor 6F1 [Xenopus laevis]OCU01529.1 hypothetical protein XELAEV_18007320mg [Xenopus laevis]